MSMFRSKKLDLGCFVNVKVIRDHTKRKIFAEHEPERYVSSQPPLAPFAMRRASITQWESQLDLEDIADRSRLLDKLSDTSSATLRCLRGLAPKHSSN